MSHLSSSEPCQNGGVCRTDASIDGNGEYFCQCHPGFMGMLCEQQEPVTATPHASEVNIVFVVGVSLSCVVIIIFMIIALLAVRSVKKARATRGTYSPSAQEMFGNNSAIEILKPPPEERLI